MPSPSRFCTTLGRRSPALNTSACRPVPKKVAMTRSRTSPAIRAEQDAGADQQRCRASGTHRCRCRCWRRRRRRGATRGWSFIRTGRGSGHEFRVRRRGRGHPAFSVVPGLCRSRGSVRPGIARRVQRIADPHMGASLGLGDDEGDGRRSTSNAGVGAGLLRHVEQGFGGRLRHLQQCVHGSIEADPQAVGRGEIAGQLLQRGPQSTAVRFASSRPREIDRGCPASG